ncbi:MAG: hypothetical protein ACNA7Y_05535, partial [Gammaproteobacteria bacterium]
MKNSLTDLPLWHQLHAEQQKLAAQPLSAPADFILQHAGWLLDYSRNCITQEIRQLLCQLAEHVNLHTEIKKLFSGEKINTTENRAARHSDLRDPSCLETQDALVKMEQCIEK